MKLLTTVLLTVATAFAQSSDRLPVTDAEKIADALRAGPAFITKDAFVIQNGSIEMQAFTAKTRSKHSIDGEKIR
jgi:hypothetical protein